MRSYFITDYDVDEIKHLKTLAREFDISPFVDNVIVNDKVQVTLVGDVAQMNLFNRQYQQYLQYRQRLKNYRREHN